MGDRYRLVLEEEEVYYPVHGAYEKLNLGFLKNNGLLDLLCYLKYNGLPGLFHDAPNDLNCGSSGGGCD